MAQAADFFVSYTSADRAWAEWIAWQLEAEGYQVVVQAWDFTPGHDWAHEMQHATTKAERVVAVLSAGETSGQTSHRGHPPRSSQGGVSLRTQGRPAGGRLRRPSSGGDGTAGRAGTTCTERSAPT